MAPTSAGVRWSVAIETATTTVKASGTVQATDWVVNVSGQPSSGGPSTVSITAPIAASPPTSTPAAPRLHP